MADKVGDIYYEAHVRGDRLPQEVRKLGRKTGDGMGDEIGNALERRLKSRFSALSSNLLPALRKDGRITASGFTDAFENVLVSRIRGMQSEIAEVFADTDGLDNFAKRFRSSGEAVDDLRGKLRTLNAEGGINEEMFKSLSASLDEWKQKNEEAARSEEDSSRRRREALNGLNIELSELRRQSDEASAAESRRRKEALNGLGIELSSMERRNQVVAAENEGTRTRVSLMDKLSASISRQREGFTKLGGSSDGAGRRLSRLTKIVLLVTAALPQLIALSSAAGAGITVLAGAAIGGIVGLGALGLAMVGLNKDLSELPEKVRPAAEAFQGFIQAAKDAQGALQAGAADGLAVGFTNLKALIEGLGPTLQALGASVGQTFAAFTAGLVPGTEGFERLTTLLQMAGPLFDGLMSVVSNLGSALGGTFIALEPIMANFVNYLNEITEAWASWSNSDAGRAAILEWGTNAQTIMGALSDLIRALSDMFADIVTPELVASFTGFIGQLTGFIPTLGNIIKLVEDLMIFEILGALFGALTPIIDALMPVISTLANELGGSLVKAIGEITPTLTLLASSLAPIISALTPIIPLVLGLATTLINSLIPALMPIIDLVLMLAENIMATLGPALEPLIGIFMQLLGPILEIVGAILNALMPLISPLVGLLGLLSGHMMSMMMPAFEVFAAVLKGLEPVLIILAELVGALIGTIVALITGDFSAIPGIWEDAWAGMSAAVEAMVQFATDAWAAFTEWIGAVMNVLQAGFNAWTGAVDTAWNNLWGGMEDIVKNVWNGIVGFIEGGVNSVIDLINGLIKSINSVGSAVGITIGSIPKANLPRMASGGIARSRLQAIIGEAGPEAVVPLNRPLHQVDPAVRELSAFAQGKQTSTVGAGRTVNFEAGAISVVTPTRNPVLVASMVVDEITENALN